MSGKSANAIFLRFLGLFETEDIVPNMVLNQPDSVLRNTGLSNAKVAYIKDTAHKVFTNAVDLDSLHTKSDAEVIAELTSIKGVGKLDSRNVFDIYFKARRCFCLRGLRTTERA